jgi:hypothetical protein
MKIFMYFMAQIFLSLGIILVNVAGYYHRGIMDNIKNDQHSLIIQAIIIVMPFFIIYGIGFRSKTIFYLSFIFSLFVIFSIAISWFFPSGDMNFGAAFFYFLSPVINTIVSIILKKLFHSLKRAYFSDSE